MAREIIDFMAGLPESEEIPLPAAQTRNRLGQRVRSLRSYVPLGVVFLPDAVDAVPAAAVTVCTSHAGQGCVLGTRLFVPQSLKAQIVERAAAVVSALRLGSSTDPTTEVGPVISASQVARCEHFVRLAIERGARVAAGGKRPANLDHGFFFEPTDVNGALSSTFVPFGGIKSSGLGHERGVEGMRMFQRLRIFSVTE